MAVFTVYHAFFEGKASFRVVAEFADSGVCLVDLVLLFEGFISQHVKSYFQKTDDCCWMACLTESLIACSVPFFFQI